MSDSISEEEKTAIECIERTSRFGFNKSCDQLLEELFKQFFSNNIEKDVLDIQYNLLKKYVKDANLIGLILYGYYKLEKNIVIYSYIDKNNETIKITVKNGCIYLMQQITKSEIIEYCLNTPNFNMYYKPSEI